MLFDGPGDLVRILVVGTAAYAALLLLLRASGKRTLSKLNAFDLVVTVALGSTLATIILSSSVSLAEGALALGLLVGLQWLVAWLSSRARPVERLVKAEPRLLVHRGRMLAGAMRAERVTAAEVRQAVRAAGGAAPGDAEAVVLETDGNLSVVLGADRGPADADPLLRAPEGG